jgi:hypothetical protein
MQEKNAEDGLQEAKGNYDDRTEEDPPMTQPSKRKRKKKARQKQRIEELKSKSTGVGLKISLESTPVNNKKIVFDDSNLPTDEDGNDDVADDEPLNSQIAIEGENHNDYDNGDDGDEGDDDDDDDDAVEEVQGKAARDEAMDQMKTEAKQSLKTVKKRKRKPRKEKTAEVAATTKNDNDSDADDDEMDADFFAQLESVRKAELEEREELEKSAAREALKGRHTTFVFAKHKGDEDAMSDPVQINKNIQVVVLKEPSSAFKATANRSFQPNSTISEKALRYSRNRLKDGSDPAAGATEMKRKRNRSGEDVQPWKRGRQRLSMGRSRLTKGKPAAFFKRKKR